VSNIIGDEPCPQCRENGRDTTGNHLMIFQDGGGYCNRCGYVKPSEGLEEPSDHINTGVGMNVADVQKLPIAALTQRGIAKDIAERYGVRVEYDEGTGEEKAYYYPIETDRGVIAYHVRDLPKTFHRVGESTKGKQIKLGGQSTCQPGGKKLLICEAQDDGLAASQMLWRKYPNYLPNVVWLWGANTKLITDNLDFINSYQEVLLSFDMDEAGQKVVEEAVKIIGDKAKVVKLEEKDANDMLLNGKSASFINAFFSAKSFTPVGIVEGGIGLEILLTPIEKGIKVDTLPNTMEKLQGLRQGELTIVLAPAGVGKTTISKEIGYALNKAGKKIVHVFLEEDLKKTQQSYIAMDNNVHLAKFRKDPSCIPVDKVTESYNKLVENQLYLDHWGSMSPDEVMKHFRYGANWGAEFGILDHISMVFSGTETTNERKEIDMLLTNMAAFTRESGMHLVVISHIKRTNRPFRKSDAYPYWETVASDAGRGSGAFEQLADNIITLEVEYMDEDMNKGRIRTRVAKNREWSTLGVGDILTYSYETGRISPEEQLTISGAY
jgi:twinkle protein